MNILVRDIHNAYLTENCREIIWTIAGPELVQEAVSIVLIKMALYGLK